MTITVPSIPVPVPQSTDPTNFDERADALLAALPAVVVAQNLQNIENNSLNATAVTAAATATTKSGEASASATAASGSASTATSQAGTATTSAASALDSQNAAAGSATAASGSASAASTSATTASTQASNAATSASTSTTQAGIATAQAVIATAKAVLTAADVVTTAASQAAALASKNASGVSEVNALASANAAALSYDSFDDRYLGTKAADPSLDNDGASLLAGALYFNTASNAMRVYNGTTWQSTNLTAIADALYFRKPSAQAHCFTKTGAGTIAILAATDVAVAGQLVSFSVQTAVVMPTLTAGTDYAIYACTDGTIRADASFSFPTGYTALNSRKIGGFHYAPGGNAAARAGGDTTPAINEYSIWDLKFKPASPDPRGQMLVSGGFWADIYPLGVDHIINGTSKFNVTIADGSSPPKVPTQFGGNGTATYTTLTWWESAEVLAAYGKRLPSYAEFAALAFGTTEATSGGTDPISTILRAAFTSKWGAILATGNMWFWGANFGGGAAGAAWTANTTGRGSTYQMENAALFGGSWDGSSYSGSRASNWANSPTFSYSFFGARGVCDHVVLE
jgi:hypothetical protein